MFLVLLVWTKDRLGNERNVEREREGGGLAFSEARLVCCALFLLVVFLSSFTRRVLGGLLSHLCDHSSSSYSCPNPSFHLQRKGDGFAGSVGGAFCSIVDDDGQCVCPGCCEIAIYSHS